MQEEIKKEESKIIHGVFNKVDNEDEKIETSGIKPENFDQIPEIKLDAEGKVAGVVPQTPEMTREQIREVVSKELGREVTDEELETLAKRVRNRTKEYPKIPLEFKEMRGMLFHLFTKTILENGEVSESGIAYKGTTLSLKQEKNMIGKKETHYVFTNKARSIKFSIKNGGDYAFNFIKGDQRNLRRLINSSFLTHFNELIEKEKKKSLENEKKVDEYAEALENKPQEEVIEEKPQV